MCFARRDEMHQVRTVGDVPMTMYLSVTPHIDPTHTMWDEQGNKWPFTYGNATKNERASQTEPAEEFSAIAERHLAAARSLEVAAIANAMAQCDGIAALAAALDARDRSAVRAAIEGMWPPLFETDRALLDLSETWNAFSPEADAPPDE
jgi:hypothetical protein